MKNRLLLWLLLAAGVLTIIIPLVKRSIRNAKQAARDSQLLAAIREEDAYRVQKLTREGANPNAIGNSEYDSVLFQAIVSANPAMVQTLLDAGASLKPVREPKVTPFMVAACSDFRTDAQCRAIFHSLRDKGERLEERDSIGFTPLMRAVWSGNVSATRVLLEMGADRKAVNNQGQNVWYWTDRMPDTTAQIRSLLHEYNRSPQKQKVESG